MARRNLRSAALRGAAGAQRGVFGVPTFEVDGHLFWGFDSLAMLRAYLDGDDWFAAQWSAVASVQQGLGG